MRRDKYLSVRNWSSEGGGSLVHRIALLACATPVLAHGGLHFSVSFHLLSSHLCAVKPYICYVIHSCHLHAFQAYLDSVEKRDPTFYTHSVTSKKEYNEKHLPFYLYSIKTQFYRLIKTHINHWSPNGLPNLVPWRP